MVATTKIYGLGWVGKSMLDLFPESLVHDPAQSYVANLDVDIAFICVPTPAGKGKLNTSIVEGIIKSSKDKLLVVRSTVNPGDCEYWSNKYKKDIVMQPEFLGETPAHPLLDSKTRKWLVIGGKQESRRKLIDLYTTVYNSDIDIRQMTTTEAEICKLTENRAIGFKVMQMHELYIACEKAGIDYYLIRDTVYGADPRFDLWFSFIYDKLGFDSSKCLKKDIPAWCAWAESIDADCQLTKALTRKSKQWYRL